MRAFGIHTPVPNYGPPASPFRGGLVEYKLTDVELAYARAGRLDMVPTAKQRGLTAPPTVPREIKQPLTAPQRRTRTKPPHIPKDVLERAIAEGKNQAQAGRELGTSQSTISNLSLRYGLEWKPQKKRQVTQT